MAVPNDPPLSPGKWSRKPSHDCASAIAAARRRFCTHQARPPGIPFATITSPPPGFAKVSLTCVRAHTPPEPPRSRTAHRSRTPPAGSSASRHIRPQDRKQASCSRTSASAARTPHALRATAPAGSSNRKAPALTPWHQLTPVREDDLNRPQTVNDRSPCAAQARHRKRTRHRPTSPLRRSHPGPSPHRQHLLPHPNAPIQRVPPEPRQLFAKQRLPRFQVPHRPQNQLMLLG